jgi:hypothetical protein
MRTHKELKEFIKNYSLVSSMDHLIACDNHGWTDLRFTRLDNRLTPESKYYLTVNINNEPLILYYDKLLDLRYEIDEKMIKKPYIEGYDAINNRVHLHYEKDGIFRIGNKSRTDIFRVQFEECSLKELARRHDYYLYFSLLKSEERHRDIQTLLCELGMSLGFNVKLANNDITNILSKDPILLTSQMVLNFYDLNLGNIEEKKVEEDIDNIDVLWYDPKNQKIIVAFEVEFSYNYPKLLQRFSSLISTTQYFPHLVVVGDNYVNFRANYNRPAWRSIFSSNTLSYLCLNDLCDILTLNREFNSPVSTNFIFKKLINERLLPVINFI